MLAAAEKAHDSSWFLTHALAQFWWLWALAAAVGAGRVLAYLWKVRRLKRAGIFEIDAMDGHMFEHRLALLFRSLGYRAEIVGGSGGDFGADLVISKSGRRSVVQAKCWQKNVGVKAVQEVVGARGYYGTDAAFVVTNRRFTKQAQTLAQKNNVELWGRDELVAALLRARRNGRPAAEPAAPTVMEPPPLSAQAASAVATVEDVPATLVPAKLSSATPAAEAFCARCGAVVTLKVRDYCLAHPERFHGLVYCFKHQRAFKR